MNLRGLRSVEEVMIPSGLAMRISPQIGLLLAAAVHLTACARTGLEPLDRPASPTDASTDGADSSDGGTDAPQDAHADADEPPDCPAPELLTCESSGSCENAFSCAALDLDFTGARLPPGVVFERASTATWVDADGRVVEAAVDEPRFDHHDGSGALRGLLLESASENLIPSSSDLDAWTAEGIVIEDLGHPAPDGGPALTMRAVGGVVPHRITTTVLVSSADTLAVSFFVRTHNISHALEVRIQTPSASLDLALDTITLPEVAESAGTGLHEWNGSARRMADGWRRLGFTYRDSATLEDAVVTVTFGICGFDLESVADDGHPSFDLWGAQVEPGSRGSSYIPTDGGPSRRAGDDLRVAADGWFERRGSLRAELWPRVTLAEHAAVVVGTPGPFELLIDQGTSARIGESFMASGTAYWSHTRPASVVLRFAAGSCEILERGLVTATSGCASIPSPTSWTLGGSDVEPFDAHLRRVSFWPGLVSEAVAEQL